VNRKCPSRNTILQLSAPYTDLEPSKSPPPKFRNLKFPHLEVAPVSTDQTTQYDRLSQQHQGILTYLLLSTCWTYAGAATEAWSTCYYFYYYWTVCVSGCPTNCQACTYDGSSTRCLLGACDLRSYFDPSTASCICKCCLLARALWLLLFVIYKTYKIHCVSKRDPDIINCNFGKD